MFEEVNVALRKGQRRVNGWRHAEMKRGRDKGRELLLFLCSPKEEIESAEEDEEWRWWWWGGGV